MGSGADQAKWLRERLTLARGKAGQPGFLSQDEVAGRVADILKHTPAWKNHDPPKTTLRKQSISNWEKDKVQPGIDEMAAWARAVDLQLWVDVYDPNEKTVETRVSVEILRLAHELEILSPANRKIVAGMIRALRTPVPGEEIEETPED